jgi:hypothetical protein
MTDTHMSLSNPGRDGCGQLSVGTRFRTQRAHQHIDDVLVPYNLERKQWQHEQILVSLTKSSSFSGIVQAGGDAMDRVLSRREAPISARP